MRNIFHFFLAASVDLELSMMNFESTICLSNQVSINSGEKHLNKDNLLLRSLKPKLQSLLKFKIFADTETSL